MMDDNTLIPGPLDPQIQEGSEPPMPSAQEDRAQTSESESPSAAEPSVPPPPFCGYPVLKDGRWVPCGKEATDGCAYCDDHGIAEPEHPASSDAELQANVEGEAPQVQQSKTTPKTAEVPPSLTHHAACGVVGETGAHGDLGSNAIDYVGPHRPETMAKE
jgi:hypothetical protein